MLKYVKEHDDELIGGKTVTNHDTADSVILLNTYLKEKKRRLQTEINKVGEMAEGTEVECPICQSKGHVRVVKKPGKNSGKYFMTCSQYKNDNKCGFKFLSTEEPEMVEGSDGCWYIDDWKVWQDQPVGNKRKPLPVKKTAQPPAKKAAPNPPPKPATKSEPPVTHANMLKLLADMTRSLMSQIDERFDQLRGHQPDDDDSAIEGSQEAPEEVE